MTDEKQTARNDLQKIAEMQGRGISFDIAETLFINEDKLLNELTIHRLTGQFDDSHLPEIYKACLVMMAYYHPRRVGLTPYDPDGEEE